MMREAFTIVAFPWGSHRYSRVPSLAQGRSINMNCILHYFQMSEAVRPIMRAFNPAFWHLSSILGPRGHVKIESDSQAACFTE